MCCTRKLAASRRNVSIYRLLKLYMKYEYEIVMRNRDIVKERRLVDIDVVFSIVIEKRSKDGWWIYICGFTRSVNSAMKRKWEVELKKNENSGGKKKGAWTAVSVCGFYKEKSKGCCVRCKPDAEERYGSKLRKVVDVINRAVTYACLLLECMEFDDLDRIDILCLVNSNLCANQIIFKVQKIVFGFKIL